MTKHSTSTSPHSDLTVAQESEGTLATPAWSESTLGLDAETSKKPTFQVITYLTHQLWPPGENARIYPGAAWLIHDENAGASGIRAVAHFEGRFCEAVKSELKTFENEFEQEFVKTEREAAGLWAHHCEGLVTRVRGRSVDTDLFELSLNCGSSESALRCVDNGGNTMTDTKQDKSGGGSMK